MLAAAPEMWQGSFLRPGGDVVRGVDRWQHWQHSGSTLAATAAMSGKAFEAGSIFPAFCLGVFQIL